MNRVVALLEVSTAVYDEVLALLESAGYNEAILEGGEVLDMQDLGLIRKEPKRVLILDS